MKKPYLIITAIIFIAMLSTGLMSQTKRQSGRITTGGSYAVTLKANTASPGSENNESITLTYEELAEADNHLLQLVNIENELSSITDVVLACDYISVLRNNIELNEEALSDLNKLFSAAKKQGFDQFYVTEGFRDYDYQKRLYDEAGDKSLVANPYHSEHQTGLSVDISYKNMNIGNSIQGNWLMENSYLYGFILRYPEDKTDITGIPFEPWHYRYLGLPHAYICSVMDMCFEEYLDYLASMGQVSLFLNDVDYVVVYLTKGESVQIPNGCVYDVSSDNQGGMIVTITKG